MKVYEINKGGKGLTLQGMIFEQLEIIYKAGDVLFNLIKMQEEQRLKEKEPEVIAKIMFLRDSADN